MLVTIVTGKYLCDTYTYIYQAKTLEQHYIEVFEGEDYYSYR